MNMRQHKRNIMARMAINAWMWGGLGYGNSYAALGVPHGTIVVDTGMVEAAKVEYVCERLKDGVVVDTFDLREDALALVNKHIKGRKAKLVVRNSHTGELEAFSEEEFA